MQTTTKRSIYDFTDKIVYCFSDIEGYVPEIQMDIPEDVKYILSILKKTIQERQVKRQYPYSDNGTKMENSANEIDKDVALIFTGDLIDRGNQSIRLLKGMVKLKDENEDSVCLCAGNRDMNKLRMYDEFSLVIKVADNNYIPLFPLPAETTTPTKTFTLANIDNLYELAQLVADGFDDVKMIQFKYQEKDLSHLLANTNEHEWLEIGKPDKKPNWSNVFSSELSERVQNIYEYTLEAKDYPNTFFKEEVRYLCHNFKSETPDKIYHAALAILNMVMGVKWDKDILPVYLEPFNGLYIKYLERSHIIAAFKAGVDKYGIASHSGIPVDNDDNFVLTDPLGSPKTDNESPKPTIEIIKNIESEKNKVLALCEIRRENNIIIENGNLRQGNLNFQRLILMSANVGNLANLNSKRSPMISMSQLLNDGPRSLVNKNKTFNIAIEGEFTNFKDNSTQENTNATYYNIFGHQPCGYCPQIAKVGNVYHVCLDISKAESGTDANKNSFAVLAIKPIGDMVSGIIKESQNIYSYDYTLQKYSSFDYVEVKKEDKYFVVYYNPLNYKKFIAPRLDDKLQNKLIITTGDTSDADGFISVALYAKTGADLLFIINIPYPYSELQNDETLQEKIEEKEGYNKASDKPTDPDSKTSFYKDFKNPYGLGYKYKRYNDEAKKHVQLCINFVSKIWSENNAKGALNFLYSHSDGKYFYNTINPFSGNTLSNDIEVYKYTTTKNTENHMNCTLESIVSNKDIYMDMNGSCAFYNYVSDFDKLVFTDRFKGLYVMGGIDGLVMPDTLNHPFMNRIHIATMNQVYAPKAAGNIFVKAAKIAPVKFVTNNEVNANANYGISLEKTLPYILSNFGGETLQKIFRDYYIEKNKQPPIKLFDPMTSLVLIKDLLQQQQTAFQNKLDTKLDTELEIIQLNVISVQFQNQYIFEKIFKTFEFYENIIETEKVLYYDMTYGTTILLNNNINLENINKNRFLFYGKMFKEFNKNNESTFNLIQKQRLEDFNDNDLETNGLINPYFTVLFNFYKELQTKLNNNKTDNDQKEELKSSIEIIRQSIISEPSLGGKRAKSTSEKEHTKEYTKEYIKYKGRKYRVRTGKRGGKYIKIDDEKIYV